MYPSTESSGCFMANPMNRSSERSASLQKYLALHYQQTRIRDAVQRRFVSASPFLTPDSRNSSISSLSSSPGSPSSFPFSTHAISTIPEEVEEQEGIDDAEEEERKLDDINKQIKFTLTDLLNYDSTRNDSKFRAWVQSRLMDAEMELRRHRKRRVSIDRGCQEMVESIANSMEL
ncbi:hypothetical protein EV356DRAFT_530080 [Viridothelium virens]|uniref:Uncharacterized protein n=1 Tax=Viridothelium virens TaxID=1048519 RepID=A0A6A6HIJ3_VIRVR|nr:hypothetical protein EV356DRAFT_530080 [Viridothelium virens]